MPVSDPLAEVDLLLRRWRGALVLTTRHLAAGGCGPHATGIVRNGRSGGRNVAVLVDLGHSSFLLLYNPAGSHGSKIAIGFVLKLWTDQDALWQKRPRRAVSFP